METQTRTTDMGAPQHDEIDPVAGHTPAPWHFLKAAASELGFCAVGVCPAREVPEQAWSVFQQWINSGLHADMDFLARWPEPRRDPRHRGIVEGASVILTVALPYGDGASRGGLWDHVAAHARGTDYHITIRKKLESLAQTVTKHFPQCRYRTFVDTAPVLERTWARLCGLGWIGKNGALIVPGRGPRVLLGELVIANAPPPMAAARPVENGCGDCSLCVDSCPTEALLDGGQVDCGRCLSYQTIENTTRSLPESIASRVRLIFGCDDCTSVCPHNTSERNSCMLVPPPNAGPVSVGLEDIFSRDATWLESTLCETALERTGKDTIVRNARAAAVAGRVQGDNFEK